MSKSADNRPAYMRTCYWCGVPASSREHVPPKCFFPRRCRASLTTVGACSEHNQGYSEDDRHARAIMVLAGGSPEGAAFWNEHVSASYRKVKNRGTRLARLLEVSRLVTMAGAERTAVLPGREFMCRWIGKVARGLCFYHCAVPTGTCSVICDWQGKEPLSSSAPPLMDIFDRGDHLMTDATTAHPEGFAYKFGFEDRTEEHLAFLVDMRFWLHMRVVAAVVRDASRFDNGASVL